MSFSNTLGLTIARFGLFTRHRHHGVCLAGRRLCSSYSDTNQRQQLLQYAGGSVSLSKSDDDGIAVVTLNHPQRKNALSGRMMVELRDVVTELEGWTAGKGVIVQGANNTFCSGGDLKLMKSIAFPDKGEDMSRYMQETLSRFYYLPFVTVALLEGQALGGGAEVAVACDFRIAAPSATLGFVQVRMGVSPGWGGGVKLVQHVGRRHALELLCSGRILGAYDAKEMGLVDQVLYETDSEQYLDQGKNWLTTMVRGAPQVVGVAKRVVLAGMDNEFCEALEKERSLFASVWGGEAHYDAMAQNIKHK